MTTAATAHRPGRAVGRGALALGALGVVFGDIGTSPLYAFREAFEHQDLAVVETNALGVASIAFWALIVIISIKYLALVMRADNHGEGGILALTALVMPTASGGRRAAGLVLLGVFGTALLYGDGLITPAISVLSAVEGFEVASSAFDAWVIPLACVILVGLFMVQRRGTEAVGRVFGPVMVVWFATLGILGLNQIIQHPGVLEAINPIHIVDLFQAEPKKAFLALGSIFLVVTGGEALYADMGHFGRRPITLVWYGIVLPGLVCNYFGQAALLIDDPDAIESPFYRLAPDWGITPLAILATMASVIASQALISGAFSLTVQAVQLDYLPRLKILHTSAHHKGQVYVPLVNWALMIGCVGLVLGFQTSSNLAAAYGIAVTTTMVITTILFFVVARTALGLVVGQGRRSSSTPLLVVDSAFLAANIPKIPDGRLVPAAHRPRPGRADGHLAPRAAARRRADPARRTQRHRGHRRPRRRHHRPRHRRVPLQGRRPGPARPDQQPPPQQGPPRRDVPRRHRRDRRPPRRRRRAAHASRRSGQGCTRCSSASATSTSSTSPPSWRSSSSTAGRSTSPTRPTSSAGRP